MHRALALLALVPGACWPVAAKAQPPWTRQQMVEDLEQIAAAVRADWSYLDDHREHFGVDVDALLASAKAALPETGGPTDFAIVLRRFAAALQDGHAWSHVPGAAPQPARRLPFELADCVEGPVVVATAPGTKAPVRGDVLVAIDGVPYERALAARMAEVCGSTPGMRRRLAFAALLATDATTVRCTFADERGERREVEVATVAPDAPASRPADANWTLRWLRDDMALLRIASFKVPRWQEWLATKPENREPFLQEGRQRIDAVVGELTAKRARALLVDLRGNPGGTDLLGIHLAERLLEGELRYFLLSGQDHGAWTQPAGITYGKGEHARFLGELVVLIDEGCFSTADNFARCLDDLHPSCTFVGRPTGGGTGAPRKLVEAKHTKAVLGGCTQRVFGPNGKLTEGRGTVPDIPVPRTRADRLAGRDADLEAALKHLDRARRGR